jgi:hypothetical protein
MKRSILFLFLALSLAGIAWAQPAGPTSPPAHSPPLNTPPATTDPMAITPDEWREVRAAHSAVLQANPSLLAEHEKLVERMRALEDKIDAAMVKADPTLSPIIAKFEGNRPHPGTPAAPPASATPPARQSAN